MKYLSILLSIIFIYACENKQEGKVIGEYTSYGAEINPENTFSQEEMLHHYANMKAGDTLSVKFKSNIKEVCQMKGCWVKMDLDDATENMVIFKEHDFAIPKDSDGKEAIVSGKAFLKEVSVEDQKHYAQDAGESEEAIAAITSPKTEYHFVADGILVKE